MGARFSGPMPEVSLQTVILAAAKVRALLANQHKPSMITLFIIPTAPSQTSLVRTCAPEALPHLKCRPCCAC